MHFFRYRHFSPFKIMGQFYRTPLTESYFLWLQGSFLPWNQPSHPSRSNFLPKLTVEQLTDTAFLTKKVTIFFVDLTADKPNFFIMLARKPRKDLQRCRRPVAGFSIAL